MGRQYRWFWGIVLTVFFATVMVGIYPYAQTRQPTRQLTRQLTRQPMTSVPIMESFGLSSQLIAHAQEPAADSASTSIEFIDPTQTYAIAQLEGVQVYSVAGTSVLESADGNLAYSVIVIPTLTGNNAPLTDAALAQVAQATFRQGEGFTPKIYQSLPQGGIKIDWSARMTTKATQPLSGTIFAQQFGNQVFLLMIAATETGQADLVNAIAVLPSSLRPLQ